LTKEALKQAELNISHFFNWNLFFFTFYDHLEEFISLGLLMESEKIIIPSIGNGGDNKAVINEATQIEDLDSESKSNNVSPSGS